MVMRAKQKGVAVVEFAIALMPMLLMVFGITEFGRALYQYNTLVKATRGAARFLMDQTPGDTFAIDQAKCLAVTGSTAGAPNCSDPALAPGLTSAMVKVCDAVDATACPGTPHNGVPTGSGSINLVTVKITGFPFQSLVPTIIPMNIQFGDINTTMRGI